MLGSTTRGFLFLAAAICGPLASAQVAASSPNPSKEPPRPTLRSLPPGAVSPGDSFVVAAYGESFLFNLKAEVERLPFLKEVYRPFGFSADSRYFLYLKAYGRTPTFSLYMYDLTEGTEKRVTEKRVYNASWSPTSLDIAIVTLDAADRYGISVVNGLSGNMRKAGEGLLDPEYMEWSPDGKRVLFSKLTPVTENYFHDGDFDRSLHEYDLGLDTTAEIEKGVLARHSAGGERRYIEVEAGSSARLKGRPVNAAMGGETLYIESAEGRGVVKRWDGEKGEYETVGEGRIYASFADGVVIRDLTPGGVVFRLAAKQSKGDLYTFTSSWKLPFEGTGEMQQGGALFSGGACDGRACNIVSHGAALGYALDWQQRPNQSMGPARILAPEEGTVAAVVTNITCNSGNTSCQIGWDNYSSPCVNNGGAGNYVALAHPDGSFTFYAHMRSATSPLTVGQFVGQGAYLGDQGHSGSTGNNFGNYQGCGDHIHFQRQVGVAVWAQSIPTDFMELPCSLSCRTIYTSQNADTSVPASVSALTVKLTPESISPGATSPANRVILPVAAIAPGTTITLSSSNPSVTVPASVTVPTGATHAVFPITVSAAAAPGGVTITAQTGSQVATAILSVRTISIFSFSLSTASVVGGNPTYNNQVVLTDVVAAGGTIALTSTDPAATPGSGTLAIPAGGSHGSFTIATTPVAATAYAYINANYGASNRGAVLTVNPSALSSVTALPASVLGGAAATGTVVMNGTVPVNPIQVTLTSSHAAATVAPTVTVNPGSTQATFPITTSAVLTPTPVTITAAYNGIARTVNLTINPVQLSSLTLGASSAVGGATVTGNKTILTGQAGPGDITVQLVSSNPAVAPVPATVTVPAGATQSPVFSIATTAVSAVTAVTITATYSGVAKTVNLTVNPVAPLSVSLSSATPVGGAIVAGNRVNLNVAAGPGGADVTLASSDAAASVPATVTVAPGSTQSAAFSITTSAVATATAVTITATYNGIGQTANLTVNPLTPLSVSLSSATAGGGAVVAGNRVNLNGAAGPGGADITLASSDPAVASVPATVTVVAGSTQSPVFSITTSAVAQNTVVTITATYNGVSRTANLTLTSTGLSSLTLGGTTVVGGAALNGSYAVLNGPAGAGGVTVALTSSDPAVAAAPASVYIAAGASQSGTFAITTAAVTAAAAITITATYNGVSKTAVLSVVPVVLTSITLGASSVVGGVAIQGTKLNLNAPAGPGGVVVSLSTSDPSRATVASTVTITAGATQSAAFPIATYYVPSAAAVNLIATLDGVTKTSTISLNPPVLLSVALSPVSVVGPASAANNKINLNGPAGPAGAVVQLASSDPTVAAVPSSVTVAAGSAASPSFVITTTVVSSPTPVTITATSNGVTRTAVLTVMPVALASVTAGAGSVIGGLTIQGSKVTLSAPAGPGGIVVSLSASDPSLAAVAATVTVPAGATQSPTFPIVTSYVPSATTVTLIATYNGVTKTAAIALNPPVLASLALSPASVVGPASSTNNTVNLSGPAGPAGATVALTSSDPAIAAVPVSVAIVAGASKSGSFAITTTVVSAPVTVTITATYNGVVRTTNLTVGPVALASVTLPGNRVPGGVIIQGTKFNLNAPAGPGGVVVSLSTSDSSLATIAATVTIPAGAIQSAAVPIATSYVPSWTTVNLIASYGGVTKTPVITLNPPDLWSVALSPASVVGPASATNNKINLNAPAGPGGAVVQLVSSNPAVAAVPSSVTVGAGSTASPSFPITTTIVAAPTPVTITATYNGVTKTAILTVNP